MPHELWVGELLPSSAYILLRKDHSDTRNPESKFGPSCSKLWTYNTYHTYSEWFLVQWILWHATQASLQDGGTPTPSCAEHWLLPTHGLVLLRKCLEESCIVQGLLSSRGSPHPCLVAGWGWEQRPISCLNWGHVWRPSQPQSSIVDRVSPFNSFPCFILPPPFLVGLGPSDTPYWAPYTQISTSGSAFKELKTPCLMSVFFLYCGLFEGTDYMSCSWLYH